MIRFLYAIWLIVKHRPFFNCPFCRGDGGYRDYYGEWCECSACYGHWEELYDFDIRCAQGRVPFWLWIRGKASIMAKLGEPATLTRIALCKIGLHRWMKYDVGGGDTDEMCAVCYTEKKKKRNPNE